jgi:hypothetical protein
MTLNISVNSAAPAITNVIMGYVGQASYYLDLQIASAEDIKIVNDFLQVIGNHINVDILDYDFEKIFEANIVIPGEADLEVHEVSYSNFQEEDKIKITSFVNLINSLV